MESAGEGTVQRQVVEPGDCLLSIAQDHGFFWKTLWDHADNAALKQQRGDPLVLQPGDVLVIPERRRREESRPADQRHRFKRRGVPAKLRLRFLEEGEPIASTRVVFTLDGVHQEAATDGDGGVEVFIPRSVREALAVVGEGDSQRYYVLRVGWLDPADTVVGAKQRLSNLGWYSGPFDGEATPDFAAALQSFQAEHELPMDGQLSLETAEKLKFTHGS